MKKFTLLAAIALTLSFLGTASSFAKEGQSLKGQQSRASKTLPSSEGSKGASTGNNVGSRKR